MKEEMKRGWSKFSNWLKLFQECLLSTQPFPLLSRFLCKHFLGVNKGRWHPLVNLSPLQFLAKSESPVLTVPWKWEWWKWDCFSKSSLWPRPSNDHYILRFCKVCRSHSCVVYSAEGSANPGQPHSCRGKEEGLVTGNLTLKEFPNTAWKHLWPHSLGTQAPTSISACADLV